MPHADQDFCYHAGVTFWGDSVEIFASFFEVKFMGGFGIPPASACCSRSGVYKFNIKILKALTSMLHLLLLLEFGT